MSLCPAVPRYVIMCNVIEPCHYLLWCHNESWYIKLGLSTKCITHMVNLHWRSALCEITFITSPSMEESRVWCHGDMVCAHVSDPLWSQFLHCDVRGSAWQRCRTFFANCVSCVYKFSTTNCLKVCFPPPPHFTTTLLNIRLQLNCQYTCWSQQFPFSHT